MADTTFERADTTLERIDTTLRGPDTMLEKADTSEVVRTDTTLDTHIEIVSKRVGI